MVCPHNSSLFFCPNIAGCCGIRCSRQCVISSSLKGGIKMSLFLTMPLGYTIQSFSRSQTCVLQNTLTELKVAPTFRLSELLVFRNGTGTSNIGTLFPVPIYLSATQTNLPMPAEMPAAISLKSAITFSIFKLITLNNELGCGS